MESNENKPEEARMSVSAEMHRMVPKMCTSISVSLLNNKKNAIMTLMYGDDNSAATLIDRIAVDIDHLAALVKVLTTVLEDANYVENN